MQPPFNVLPNMVLYQLWRMRFEETTDCICDQIVHIWKPPLIDE